MGQDELIDSHVSLKQSKLAVQTLHDHEGKKDQKRQETELLPGKEQNVWLCVTVKKIHPGHKFKPVKIPIVHPLVDPRTTPICLITKDPQRQYKDLLETHGIKFISRVVGVLKLKGKFKPFEARRMLLKENGMFLADERIVPLLPKLLGVKWFEAKKQPIPVCLTRKDLKGELERAISSTYMNQNQGTCTSIKIGTLSQTPAQILANLKSALPVIVKHIKDGWENIQCLHIKTNSSVSLPIWTCKLDDGEGGRWNGLTAVTDEGESDSEEEEEEDAALMEVDEKKENKKEKPKGKGKRVASEEQDEEVEVEKPKKKVKGSEAKVAQETPKTSKIPQVIPTSPAPSSKKPAKSALKLTSSSDAVSSVTAPPKSDAEGDEDNKKKKSRKPKTSASSATIEPAPAPAPAPSAPPKIDIEVQPAAASASASATVPKPKKKKSKANPPIDGPVGDISESVTVAPDAVTIDVDTEGTPAKKEKKEKKKKARVSEVAVADPPSQAAPSVPDADSTPATPAAETKPAKLNKKAKARLSAAAASATEAPSESTTVAPPSTSNPTEQVPAPDAVDGGVIEKSKKKKSKKSKTVEVTGGEAEAGVAVEVEAPVIEAESNSLSKDELKQKRSSGTGEKKKEKVVKSKGKKSAKDAVTGKKAAQ